VQHLWGYNEDYWDYILQVTRPPSGGFQSDIEPKISRWQYWRMLILVLLEAELHPRWTERSWSMKIRTAQRERDITRVRHETWISDLCSARTYDTWVLTTYAFKLIKIYLIVSHNLDHVLHCLLLSFAHILHNYCLRPRAHDRSLTERLTNLTDCNFIIRMLFYQDHWQCLMPACFIALQLRSDSC